MNLLKKTGFVLLALLIAFVAYTAYINRHSINMTSKQKVLKAVYPIFMWATKLAGVNSTILTNAKATPAVSFYSLQTATNDGGILDFSTLKGKQILLVNTASDCGYTNQYAELETLYQQYKNTVEIIAFPANDFKEQEKGTDSAIGAFCKKNYGVTFPIMARSVVIKSTEQNLVFKWLTNAASNGWNSKAPSWNFSKYLINQKGQLTHYFDPSISPLSKEIIEAISYK
jgi:glutathione peroxidase